MGHYPLSLIYFKNLFFICTRTSWWWQLYQLIICHHNRDNPATILTLCWYWKIDWVGSKVWFTFRLVVAKLEENIVVYLTMWIRYFLSCWIWFSSHTKTVYCYSMHIYNNLSWSLLGKSLTCGNWYISHSSYSSHAFNFQIKTTQNWCISTYLCNPIRAPTQSTTSHKRNPVIYFYSLDILCSLSVKTICLVKHYVILPSTCTHSFSSKLFRCFTKFSSPSNPVRIKEEYIFSVSFLHQAYWHAPIATWVSQLQVSHS